MLRALWLGKMKNIVAGQIVDKLLGGLTATLDAPLTATLDAPNDFSPSCLVNNINNAERRRKVDSCGRGW